jgi:hypothetical protein
MLPNSRGSARGAAIPDPQPESSTGGAASYSLPDGGAGGTAANESQGGAGGATGGEGGRENVQLGASQQGMPPPPPPPQPRVPCAKGPRARQREVGSGMNGGAPMSHCSAQAPRGINNFGEALIAICTFTSFPLAQGMPAYVLWEARLRELTKYMQRRIAMTHSCSCSIAQGTGATTMHHGGVAAMTAHR